MREKVDEKERATWLTFKAIARCCPPISPILLFEMLSVTIVCDWWKKTDIREITEERERVVYLIMF